MEEKYNGLCQIATGSRLGGGKAVSNFKLWMDWEKKNESVEETQCPDVDLLSGLKQTLQLEFYIEVCAGNVCFINIFSKVTWNSYKSLGEYMQYINFLYIKIWDKMKHLPQLFWQNKFLLFIKGR